MSDRPPLSALLADPASLVLRTDLLRAGYPERAVDAIFRRAGRRLEGFARPFVLAGDLERDTAPEDASAESSSRDPGAGRPNAPVTIPTALAGTAYIIARGEGSSRRFLVRYRLGGRDSKIEYAGSFRRKSDAVERRNFLVGIISKGEGATIRSRLRAAGDSPNGVVMLRVAAKRWEASRVDVSAGTAQTYRVALGRILPRLGDRSLEAIDVAAVTDLVAGLSSLKRESIRKTLNVLAMILDHARVTPNPVRDPLVKLPRGEKREVNPPTAEHVEAVFRLLPSSYRLPLLVLDATGMRVGELEGLTWGDVDEARGRWRVSAAVSKSGAARWVVVPSVIFAAVVDLVPRDDRTPARPVFGGFGSDRFRTAITRACTGAGVPAFSPHDLRHRRVSLLHLAGMPLARIGDLVGHGDIVTTARTYTHVLIDETELDYASLVG